MYHEGNFVPGCFVSLIIFALLLVFTFGNVELAFAGTIILVSVGLFFVAREEATKSQKELEGSGSLSEGFFGCSVLIGIPLLALCIGILILFFWDSYSSWIDSFMERALGTGQGILGVVIISTLLFTGTFVIPRILPCKKSTSQSTDDDGET